MAEKPQKQALGKKSDKPAAKSAAAPATKAAPAPAAAAAMKPAVQVKTTAAKPAATAAAERERLIAEAAYYRAEKRGFAPGHSVQDWLAAERSVDEALAKRR